MNAESKNNQSAAAGSYSEGSDCENTPRIYVACLATYNSGCLHGRWISAIYGPDHIAAEVRTLLKDSPVSGAEEWAIHDYDGIEGCSIPEFASFDAVSELADFIDEHGALGTTLYNTCAGNLDEAPAAIENYASEYGSAAEFAEGLHEHSGTLIPDCLRCYIDWQAMARDMALNGEITIIQTGFDEVHVFWTH